jgi:hypothetical protein
MKQIEEAGGGFYEVASNAQVRVTVNLAEADQKFIVTSLPRIEAQRL